MSSKRSGNMIMAGIIGAIAGAVGGLLFAPRSGKETRDEILKLAQNISKQIKTNAEDTETRVKQVFGEVTKSTMDKYQLIRSTIVSKVAAVKMAGNDIDRTNYTRIVDLVISEFKDDLAVTKLGASRMAEQMKKDWEKVKKALTDEEKPTKEVEKKA